MIELRQTALFIFTDVCSNSLNTLAAFVSSGQYHVLRGRFDIVGLLSVAGLLAADIWPRVRFLCVFGESSDSLSRSLILAGVLGMLPALEPPLCPPRSFTAGTLTAVMTETMQILSKTIPFNTYFIEKWHLLL